MLIDIVQIIQNMIFHPSVSSVFALLISSLVNELVSGPYVVILSSQLIFAGEPLTTALFTKLFLFTAIPVALGSTIGSLAVYGLAYFGGKPAIEKFGKYFRVSWKDIEKVESKFKSIYYDELIFLVLRSIPILPSFPVSAVVGILRMSPAPYFFLTMIGFTMRIVIMFALVGLGIVALAH